MLHINRVDIAEKQLSHWLQVTTDLLDEVNVRIGDLITLEIEPVQIEPEPELPEDLEMALMAAPEAKYFSQNL